MWTFGLGVFAGLWLGGVIGAALARFKRALRDLRTTRQTIEGLHRAVTSEAVRWVGYGLLGLLTLVCAIGAGIHAGQGG